ncbi:Protein lin-9-like protein [Armadillidium nasatum]|uniref:Protein lin-9-like protein n=1 Tax=Armadillidium nasatum TaxID=96803 RepID=A0A5N5TM09_9CRUS|nr:Protein lin-9-like protein [Armadillidium nasatum]
MSVYFCPTLHSQKQSLLSWKKRRMSGSLPGQDKYEDSPLSALGLQRIGDKKPSTSKESSLNLNRRGMPTRIRKKNKMYFDEDIVTSPSHTKSPKRLNKSINSPKKPVIVIPPSPPTPSPTPPPVPISTVSPQSTYEIQKMAPPVGTLKVNRNEYKIWYFVQQKSSTLACTINSPDKKIAQTNGLRLRNFLKLPQAHKWVYFEWFYSNIDKPLFEGENDFQNVLKRSFPSSQGEEFIPSSMGTYSKNDGKATTLFSALLRKYTNNLAFFDEERQSLTKRRQVLRFLQQRKLTDVASLNELPLPSHIPMQLVVGTKVTARLRKPENGLYTGIIDAVDTSDNTYRITFDRNGIGTHSIPDYEVLSNEGFDMMPLSSFSHQFRPRIPFGLMTPPRALLPKPEVDPISMDSPTSLSNDPILAQSPCRPSRLTVEDSIGGFPVRSLVGIVTLSKILESKERETRNIKESE